MKPTGHFLVFFLGLEGLVLAVLREENSPSWPELGGSQHPSISQPSYPTTLLEVLESSRAALARIPSAWLSMAPDLGDLLPATASGLLPLSK